jgi:methylenetetrahydrofolate dehydrogenase (NADP+) / methenyltetrahydrofolate cyclohydrolase
LAVILVGNDPASNVYVSNKEKACSKVGFYSEKILLPENATPEELFAVIDRLNVDPKIHGILCQFPLPAALRHIEAQVILRINPDKDVMVSIRYLP